MDAPLTREQTTHVAQRCQTGPKNEKKKSHRTVTNFSSSRFNGREGGREERESSKGGFLETS